jgi:hypothetical protein
MTNKDCCSFNVGGGSRFFVQKPDKWSKYPAIQNVDIACKKLNNVESIDFCDGTYIGPGDSFDIRANDVLALSGKQDPLGAYNGASIVTKDRVYQELNPDASWNTVNGYVALAKDSYPNLSETTAEKAINEWISNITNEPSSTRSRPHGIIWCPEKGLFVSANVATGSSLNIITTSPDGLNWTGRTLLDPASNPVNICAGRGVAYSPELDRFVMVFINVSSFTLPNRTIATSTDGINWTQLPTIFDRAYIDVVWAKELGLFVAISSSSNNTDQVAISNNGIDWQKYTIPSGLGEYQSICWSAELGLLVAVRSGTTGIATSPDGIIWTPRTTPNNGHFQIDWSPALGLFAVCSVGTGEALPTPQPPVNTKIMTSPDGINWTYRNTPNNFGYRGIVWADNLNCFVTVGTSNSVNQLLISSDGINWKEGTLPNSITNRCITYSNELGIFVAGQDQTTSNYLTSSLAGRPPTSYNVFDSPFNKIDQDGTWTIQQVLKSGTYTAGQTTPSVSGANYLIIDNSNVPAGIIITDFTGGKLGQQLLLIFKDSNTTINSNTTIRLSQPFISTNNDTLTLFFDGSSWVEVSRSVNDNTV